MTDPKPAAGHRRWRARRAPVVVAATGATLMSGFEAHVWRVALVDGRTVAVRALRPGRASGWELDALALAAERTPAAPRVLAEGLVEGVEEGGGVLEVPLALVGLADALVEGEDDGGADGVVADAVDGLAAGELGESHQ